MGSTWDRVLTVLPAQADAAGDIDGWAGMDTTVVSAHQQGATAARRPSVPLSPTGAAAKGKNPAGQRDEPDDRGMAGPGVG